MTFSESTENMHAEAFDFEEREAIRVEMARADARDNCHVESDCVTYRALYSGGGRGETGEIFPLRELA